MKRLGTGTSFGFCEPWETFLIYVPITHLLSASAFSSLLPCALALAPGNCLSRHTPLQQGMKGEVEVEVEVEERLMLRLRLRKAWVWVWVKVSRLGIGLLVRLGLGNAEILHTTSLVLLRAA
jgi:hypothetical protein